MADITLNESIRDEITNLAAKLALKASYWRSGNSAHIRRPSAKKPDQLRSLDGPELLHKIHNRSNRDSLVYWLEFENDEEFPTPRFGSIAGGSALKFSIFYRKETGSWMGRSSGNVPVEISEADALCLATKAQRSTARRRRAPAHCRNQRPTVIMSSCRLP